MAHSVMINLDDLLFAAYNLGRQSENLTKAELRTKLLMEVPILGSVTEKTEKTEKPKTEKTKAEKPAVELCCARTFYDKEHLEDGKLKVMCDDETNQFGGRCKFKQSGETTFCKHHAEKQPHGVWGEEYTGKLKSLIEKANAPAEKEKPVKKITKKAPVSGDDPATPSPRNGFLVAPRK